MTAKPDTPYTTRHRHRVAAGQVRLQAPWDWMGVQMAMQLAAAAYRIASYQTRHVQAQDVAGLEDDPDGFNLATTEHLTMEQMRAAFADALVDAFGHLVRGAAVDQRVFPDDQFAQVATSLLDTVPSHWRPQYPQFGAFEPGKVVRTGT